MKAAQRASTARGVHHLALCTEDMKATVDFYVDVLGFPLVHAMKVPPGLLGIYFIDPNGIRLEFACQPADGAQPGVIDCVLQTKAEAGEELATLPGATKEWVARRVAALPEEHAVTAEAKS